MNCSRQTSVPCVCIFPMNIYCSYVLCDYLRNLKVWGLNTGPVRWRTSCAIETWVKVWSRLGFFYRSEGRKTLYLGLYFQNGEQPG